MKKKLTTVEFRGTPEQEEKLLAVIEEYRGEKGAMMPILQKAQEIYGYLPLEVQKIIAEKTDTAVEEIYGIASFYAQFKLNPDGEVALPWHRMLCQGFRRHYRRSIQRAERPDRQYIRRRQIFSGSDQMYRRVRSCAGSDRKR